MKRAATAARIGEDASIDELSAHVAAVGLQQERLRLLYLVHGAVVEQPPVAAVALFRPDRCPEAGGSSDYGSADSHP